MIKNMNILVSNNFEGIFNFEVTKIYYEPSDRNYLKAALVDGGVSYEVTFCDNCDLLYMHTTDIDDFLCIYDVLSLDRKLTESFSKPEQVT